MLLDEAGVQIGGEGRRALSAYAVPLVHLPGAEHEIELPRRGAERAERGVIVLTARGTEEDKVRGLRLGADDYVTKPFGLLELLARVDAIRRRLRLSSPARERDASPIVLGEIRVEPATRAVYRAGAPVAVRPKEFDLLLALARRDGEVVSRYELLEEVWGYGADVVSRTVDTHIGQLRAKLERNPAAPRLILTVRKSGYRLQPPGKHVVERPTA